MRNVTTVDSRELLVKLADQVLRGELLITGMSVSLVSGPDRRWRAQVEAQTWDQSTIRMGIDLAENPTGVLASAPLVTVPTQVRELIFDEPQHPVYDEDLTDEG